MFIVRRFGLYALGVLVLLLFLGELTKALSAKKHIMNDTLHQTHLIYFPQGASAKTLADILVKKHLISDRFILLVLIKQYHLSHHLKSGTYQILPHETIWDLVLKISKGDVYRIPFRIIEGTRLCEIINYLQNSKEFKFHIKMLQQISNQHYSLEGMFFPSTYFPAYGEEILPVLKLAYHTMQTKLNEVWMMRDLDLPYKTSYELLIAASIIEKETADPLERKLISGVIINRLRLGMPLQMDPTVSYALPGCRHVILGGSDLKQDSPYNSYLHQGLPPTPISMVSLSSLLAAAHPTHSSYLYFVAKGDGHHVFSSQYIQQQKAINQYIRKKT